MLTYTVPRRQVHNLIDYSLSVCASHAANNVGGYWRIVHQFAVVHYGNLIIPIRETDHACGVSVRERGVVDVAVENAHCVSFVWLSFVVRVLYFIYRHLATPAASYSGKNKKKTKKFFIDVSRCGVRTYGSRRPHFRL